MRFALPLCALLAGCSTEAPAKGGGGERPVPVRVAVVEVGPVVRPVTASGRLGYADEVRLGFKVGGLVAAVVVQEGERVERGQLLARLDPREIDAALRQARSARGKALRDLRRARRLHREEAVSGEVLQNARTAAQMTGASEAAASFNRKTSELRSPVDGVVLSRRVEPGEVVAPGAPALILGAVRSERVAPAGGRVARVGVTDRDVARIAIGDKVTLELDALPGLAIAGRVLEVAPSASPGTGLVEVEVEVVGAETAALASGLVVRATLEPQAAETRMMVPLSALVEADGRRAFVYAVSEDRRRAERRAVDIAFLAGERAAIASGLDGVREVVTQGAAYLRGDRPIQIVDGP